MSKKFRETHLCNCGRGEIIVNKVMVTGIGPNQSQPKEGIANITVVNATPENNQ